MTKEEHKERRREYMRKRVAEHREEYREKHKEYKRKWRAEHREECREHNRNRRSEHLEERREYMRKYIGQNLNQSGEKKHTIRLRSHRYLFSKHAKLDDYQIHHCFGYEDFKKFIYVPKTLHTQIHMLLRDLKIQSDANHWIAIRELVNSCDQYTYISC
jgi:hypothetical protein